MSNSRYLRKVLVISYYWPPSGGAGVQRWLKFVKYLEQFCWQPIVYTPSNPEAPSLDESLLNDIPQNVEVLKFSITEPYSIYKRFVGMKPGEKVNAGFLSEKEKPGLAENISVWLRGNFFIPDARCFWINPSVRFLTKYLKANPVDAIVSTGPPHSMHMIALKIHQKLHIPWLADFRDPWTGIDFYHELKLTRIADRKHHKLERLVLQKANAVTVVSRQMIRDFETLWQRQYDLIMNGFDEADTLQNADIKFDTNFTILYAGSLAPARNPGTLWKILSDLVQNSPGFGDVLKIKLIGKTDIGVLKDIEHYTLGNFVEKIDYLPHNEVINELTKASLLLLLINKVPNAKGIVTGKIFEYLAAGRPILNIGPVDGDAAEIISDSRAGVTVDFDDENGLKTAVLNFYNDYKNRALRSQTIVNKAFTRKALTEKMAGVLNRITGQ